MSSCRSQQKVQSAHTVCSLDTHSHVCVEGIMQISHLHAMDRQSANKVYQNKSVSVTRNYCVSEGLFTYFHSFDISFSNKYFLTLNLNVT